MAEPELISPAGKQNILAWDQHYMGCSYMTSGLEVASIRASWSTCKGIESACKSATEHTPNMLEGLPRHGDLEKMVPNRLPILF